MPNPTGPHLAHCHQYQMPNDMKCKSKPILWTFATSLHVIGVNKIQSVIKMPTADPYHTNNETHIKINQKQIFLIILGQFYPYSGNLLT